MRSYIKQVDSLNTKNQELTAENINVRRRYSNISKEKNKIISQRDSLTGTIKKASILKTYSISTSALNKRNKTTTRAKKMKKIQVCFTLGGNVIAQKGKKNVQIRIAGPDNAILRNAESGMFKFEGSEVAYSSKREIDYQGNDLNICVYWTAESSQPSGYYSVNVFADGYDIGQGGFTLK